MVERMTVTGRISHRDIQPAKQGSPWEAEGISRATYYRRKRQARQDPGGSDETRAAPALTNQAIDNRGRIRTEISEKTQQTRTQPAEFLSQYRPPTRDVSAGAP
jgi:hypothetical protein